MPVWTICDFQSLARCRSLAHTVWMGNPLFSVRAPPRGETARERHSAPQNPERWIKNREFPWEGSAPDTTHAHQVAAATRCKRVGSCAEACGGPMVSSLRRG